MRKARLGEVEADEGLDLLCSAAGCFGDSCALMALPLMRVHQLTRTQRASLLYIQK